MACRFVPSAVVARALGDRRLRFDDCRARGVPTHDLIMGFLIIVSMLDLMII